MTTIASPAEVSAKQRKKRERELRQLRALWKPVMQRMMLSGAAPSPGAGLMGGWPTEALKGWPVGIEDHTQILEELPETRARTRDASVNSPIYRAIRRTLGDHVVGDTGIVPKSAVRPEMVEASESVVDDWNRRCDDLFEETKDLADVTGRQDWSKFCRLAFNEKFDAGEVFPSFPVVERDGEMLTRINLIVAERVETPPRLASDPRYDFGIRLDKWGGPTGYWVRRGHPGNYRRRRKNHDKFEMWPRTRVLADGTVRLNVIQLYDQDRVGIPRGIPALQSTLDLLHHVPEYTSVTLDAAELQTRFAVWLMTQGDLDEVEAALKNEERETFYGDNYGQAKESGELNIAAAGDEVKFFGAQHPGQYFDPFIVRLARMVCAVHGVPYSVAFCDTQGVNYSSMRSERETFKGTIAAERRALIPMVRTWRFHVIYNAWLDGRLPANVPFESNPRMWTRANYFGPRIGHVDPAKEMAAYKLALEMKVMSHSEIIAAAGGDRDVEDVAREIAHAMEVFERYGISGAAESSTQSGGGDDAAPDSTDGDEEPEGGEDADDERDDEDDDAQEDDDE